jgi:hypothetical protein
MRSIGMKVFVVIGPLPSIGWPSEFTTRPSSFADRNGNDAARPLHNVAFLDLGELAEQHRADAVFLEVQRDAEHPVRELEHFAGHGALDTVDARDAVAERHDAANFGDVDFDGEAANLVADDLGDFVSFNFHNIFYVVSLSRIFFS